MNDPLVEIELTDLRARIVSPDMECHQLIRRLRLLKGIDSKQYRTQKRLLPYFVGSHFNPNSRRTENFTYASHFVIDIDHIPQHGASVKDVRQNLISDERVMMLFLSPGEDGLKLVFKLMEQCYDHQLLSLFIKGFSEKFAANYHLDDMLDRRCYDSTRACFFSEDPDCYLNLKAVGLASDEFINLNDMETMIAKNHEMTYDVLTVNDELSETQPGKEEIDFIKSRLNPRALLRKEKQYFVPGELEEILDDILIYLSDAKVKIESVSNINYGKKFHLRAGELQAEINLFYGKRGFTVVESPKVGTDSQLNTLVAGLMRTYFSEKGCSA